MFYSAIHVLFVIFSYFPSIYDRFCTFFMLSTVFFAFEKGEQTRVMIRVKKIFPGDDNAIDQFLEAKVLQSVDLCVLSMFSLFMSVFMYFVFFIGRYDFCCFLFEFVKSCPKKKHMCALIGIFLDSNHSVYQDSINFILCFHSILP